MRPPSSNVSCYPWLTAPSHFQGRKLDAPPGKNNSRQCTSLESTPVLSPTHLKDVSAGPPGCGGMCDPRIYGGDVSPAKSTNRQPQVSKRSVASCRSPEQKTPIQNKTPRIRRDSAAPRHVFPSPVYTPEWGYRELRTKIRCTAKGILYASLILDTEIPRSGGPPTVCWRCRYTRVVRRHGCI